MNIQMIETIAPFGMLLIGLIAGWIGGTVAESNRGIIDRHNGRIDDRRDGRIEVTLTRDELNILDLALDTWNASAPQHRKLMRKIEDWQRAVDSSAGG